jgi:hypothetical protein
MSLLKNSAKTTIICFHKDITEAKATTTKHLPWLRVMTNIVSVAVITVYITVKANVLVFRDCISTMIFNDRPMIRFGVRKIDNKMLTCILSLTTVCHMCGVQPGPQYLFNIYLVRLGETDFLLIKIVYLFLYIQNKRFIACTERHMTF